MAKYTANFTCDHELWLAFKDQAQKQGSSASEQLSRFMRSFVEEKPTEEEKKYIDELIKDRIDAYAQTSIYSLIETQDKILGQVSEIINSINPQYSCFNPDINYQEKVEEIKEKQNDTELNLNVSKKILETEPKNIVKKKEVTMSDEQANELYLAHIENNKDIDIKQGGEGIYSDKEVAELEGLNKSSVTRYRNKKSSPKDPTFFNRWHNKPKTTYWVKRDIE